MSKKLNPKTTNINQSESNDSCNDTTKAQADEKKWLNYCKTLEDLIN